MLCCVFECREVKGKREERMKEGKKGERSEEKERRTGKK